MRATLCATLVRMMNPLQDPIGDASRADYRTDAVALLQHSDPTAALVVADDMSADYWRARNGDMPMTADVEARHNAYAPVARQLRETIRERDLQRAELRAAIREREGLPRIADVPAEPIAVQCDESTDAPNAMSRVPDSYESVRSAMRPDGTVGKRGRAVISADPRAFDLPSFPNLDGTTGYHGPNETLIGPLIDYCERRSLMVAHELHGIATDRDGRYSTIGLDRIAERVYGIPRLVGSEHVSWEELLSVSDTDDAAELASAVAHLNPSDPIAAAEVWLGGTADRDHGLRHLKVHRPTVARHPMRCGPGAIGKRGPVREVFALKRGRERSGDAVAFSTIATRTTHLFAPADSVAARTFVPGTVERDDTGRIIGRTADRMAVRSGEPSGRFIGHTRHDRPTVQRNVNRKRARVARRAAETIAAPTREHLNAVVRAIAPGTSAVVRYREHDIRVSRHSEHRRYSLRVKLADGTTVARSNRRTAASVSATIANVLK